MSIKLRVYEVARDLGLDNKALVALLQSVGVPDVRNHMSAVPPEVVERVKRHSCGHEDVSMGRWDERMRERDSPVLPYNPRLRSLPRAAIRQDKS